MVGSNQRAYVFGFSAVLAVVGIGLYFVNHPLPTWQTLRWVVGLGIVIATLFVLLTVRWYRRTFVPAMGGTAGQTAGKHPRTTSLYQVLGLLLMLSGIVAAIFVILAGGVYLDRQQEAYRANRYTPAQTIQAPPPQQVAPSQTVPAAETNTASVPGGVNVPRESSFTMFDNDTMLIKFAGSEPEGFKTLPLTPGQSARVTYKGGLIYPDLNVSDEHHPIQGVAFSELNRPSDITVRFRYQQPHNAYAVLVLLGDEVYQFLNGLVEVRNRSTQDQTVVLYYNDAQPFYGDNGGNAKFEVHRHD